MVPFFAPLSPPESVFDDPHRTEEEVEDCDVDADADVATKKSVKKKQGQWLIPDDTTSRACFVYT